MHHDLTPPVQYLYNFLFPFSRMKLIHKTVKAVKLTIIFLVAIWTKFYIEATGDENHQQNVKFCQ